MGRHVPGVAVRPVHQRPHVGRRRCQLAAAHVDESAGDAGSRPDGPRPLHRLIGTRTRRGRPAGRPRWSRSDGQLAWSASWPSPPMGTTSAPPLSAASCASWVLGQVLGEVLALVVVAGPTLHRPVVRRHRLDIPVVAVAGAGRDELADDDVLLEAQEDRRNLDSMAASVSTRVVSWNDAADSHESVASDALVIPISSSTRPRRASCPRRPDGLLTSA